MIGSISRSCSCDFDSEGGMNDEATAASACIGFVESKELFVVRSLILAVVETVEGLQPQTC